MQIETLDCGDIQFNCESIWSRRGEAHRAEAAARHQGRHFESHLLGNGLYYLNINKTTMQSLEYHPIIMDSII